jgi:dienelactone hydrolase
MAKRDDVPPLDPLTPADVTRLWRDLARLGAQPEAERARVFDALGVTADDQRRLSPLLKGLVGINVHEPGLLHDGSTCDLGWQPSVLAPVFTGFTDFGPANGLPTRVRVYYPTTDGTPENAALVTGCGRYPLVIFLHGQCSEPDHFLRWDLVPRQLARSGYVVAVPQLSSIPPFGGDNPDVTRAEQVLDWMRTSWPHAALLMPPPMTGVAGHSWGALAGAMLATRLQARGAISAYASLSGGWLEWPSVPPRPTRALAIATLFVYGTGSSDLFANLEGGGAVVFGEPQGATHKVVIRDGEHWDYFREGGTTCGHFRGPCGLMRSVAADFLATFFSHYMPPSSWTLLGSTIPHSLIPPPLALTPRQEFFAGGHLQGIRALPSTTTCRVTHTWRLPPFGGGAVAFGPA